jgi:hypothetical protein
MLQSNSTPVLPDSAYDVVEQVEVRIQVQTTAFPEEDPRSRVRYDEPKRDLSNAPQLANFCSDVDLPRVLSWKLGD